MAKTVSPVARTVADIYRAVLADVSGEVFAVNLNERAAEQLVTVLSEFSEPPTVQLLAQDSVLKWLRDEFLIASTAADLTDTGALSLRAANGPIENFLLITAESVVSIIASDDQVAGISTGDATFIREAREQWTDAWSDAEEFSLRTPPRSRVYDSLAEEIGSEVETDFRTMLDSLDTTRGEERLDEVMVSLLVAAKHRVQFYEICRWGEDVGVASKATFSRVKSVLEENGLIETEDIPVDIGRPRLRLLLDDKRLSEADTDEFVSVAHSLQR